MIASLSIKNFKSLRDVPLHLGQLNFFIGTNASGKSNVFDALRVLQGIGNGFTIAEILDGKPKSAPSEQWEPIRGGSSTATFSSQTDKPVSFDLRTRRMIQSSIGKVRRIENYSVSFDASHQKLTNEHFSSGGEIYDSTGIENSSADPSFRVRYHRSGKGNRPHITCESGRPVLGQLAKGGGKWTKHHASVNSCSASRKEAGHSPLQSSVTALCASPPLRQLFSA